MSRTVPSWLDDPVCVVVGHGDGVEAAAHELAAAGATIARGPITSDPAAALGAIEAAEKAARDPVTIVLHASGGQDVAATAYGKAFTVYLENRELNGAFLLLEPAGTDVRQALVELSGPRLRANAIATNYAYGGPLKKLRALGALAAYLASDNARFADLEEVGVKITRPDTTAFREAAAPVQEKYLETDAQKEIFELVKSVE